MHAPRVPQWQSWRRGIKRTRIDTDFDPGVLAQWRLVQKALLLALGLRLVDLFLYLFLLLYCVLGQTREMSACEPYQVPARTLANPKAR